MNPTIDTLAAPRPSVLVVEGDRDAVAALCELLVNEGYEVTTAADGREALEKLVRDPAPDIILLDLANAAGDGYEFRRLQLADPRLAAIPTIALTAGTVDERVRDLHLTGWVRKPVPVDALLAVIGGQRRRKGRRHDHVVCFYDSAARLTDKACAFLAEGLARGEAALAIATARHAHRLRVALAGRSLDVPALERAGQLRILDAHRTLAEVSSGGRVQADRFGALVGDELDRLTAAAPHGRVRGFGEMVDLLWHTGDTAGALGLEQHWNRLCEAKRLALLCAYRSHGGAEDPSAHDEVLRQHSALV